MIEKTNLNRWVETLEAAKAGSKNPKYLSYLIHLASKPKRSRPSVNLDKLDKYAKESDAIIVPGKVLGAGSINKKITISAIDFSDSAMEKLKTAKCSIVKIDELIGNKSARIII